MTSIFIFLLLSVFKKCPKQKRPQKDTNQKHHQKDIMFAKEKGKFESVPKIPYCVFKLINVTFTKTSVTEDKIFISFPVSFRNLKS